MKCPICSRRTVLLDAQYCPYCGHALSNAATSSGINMNVVQNVGHIEQGSTVIGEYIDDLQISGDLIVVSRLSEFDAVDPATRRRLQDAYTEQIARAPGEARYHLALGLYYLDRRMHQEAIASLSVAHGQAPQDANVLYYLALAHIGGQRPMRLEISLVRRIESYLAAAHHNGSGKAHLYCLWAVVKYDYYLSRGMRMDPPSIQDLLSWAGSAQCQPAEMRHLFDHVPVPQSQLKDAILGMR